MLACILVSNDSRTGGVHPFIPISMVKMPVSIDKVPDWIRIDSGQRFGDLTLRCRQSCINQNFPIVAREDSDIPTRPGKDTDTTAQMLDCDLGGSPTVTAGGDQIPVLREKFTRRQPHAGDAKARAGEKLPTCNNSGGLSVVHNRSSTFAYAPLRRLVVWLAGFPRGRRAGVGRPVHERIESARPLQPPRRTDTRHLRNDGRDVRF